MGKIIVIDGKCYEFSSIYNRYVYVGRIQGNHPYIKEVVKNGKNQKD